MNQQWLRKQQFVEEFLSSSNCGKEPLKILEKPGGSPFLPKKREISFTAEWHATYCLRLYSPGVAASPSVWKSL